jgi:simple sugar transport system substrate-binding protein
MVLPCFHVIDKCGEAGIPVVDIGSPIASDAVTVLVRFDYYYQSQLMTEYLVEQAEAMNKHLYIYGLYCPLVDENCTARRQALFDTCEGHSLVTVVDGPDAKAQDDLAMNAIMDAFPAHPELNAIWLGGGMFDGTIQALQALGRYYPRGNPDHVMWVGCDDYPAAVETLREGYLDAIGQNSPWAMGDISAKAMLTIVCLGQSLPDLLSLPMTAVTPENVDESPYGAECRWGDMLMREPDLTKWPILNLEEFGIMTPSYEQLLEQR